MIRYETRRGFILQSSFIRTFLFFLLSIASISHAVDRRSVLQMMGGLLSGGAAPKPTTLAATPVSVPIQAVVAPKALDSAMKIANFARIRLNYAINDYSAANGFISLHDLRYLSWLTKWDWSGEGNALIADYYAKHAAVVANGPNLPFDSGTIRSGYYKYKDETGALERLPIGHDNFRRMQSYAIEKINDLEFELAKKYEIEPAFIHLTIDYLTDSADLFVPAANGDLLELAPKLPLTDSFLKEFLNRLKEILPERASWIAQHYRAKTLGLNATPENYGILQSWGVHPNLEYQNYPDKLRFAFEQHPWTTLDEKSRRRVPVPIEPATVSNLYLDAIATGERAHRNLSTLPDSQLRSYYLRLSEKWIARLSDELREFPLRYRSFARTVEHTNTLFDKFGARAGVREAGLSEPVLAETANVSFTLAQEWPEILRGFVKAYVDHTPLTEELVAALSPSAEPEPQPETSVCAQNLTLEPEGVPQLESSVVQPFALDDPHLKGVSKLPSGYEHGHR